MFDKYPNKNDFEKTKKIKINGMKFIIKQINPLLDLDIDHIPQIFTEGSIKNTPKIDDVNYKLIIDNMKRITEKGIVKPVLFPVGRGELEGKEAGLTINDIFHDVGIGMKIYFEIMILSINKFKGLKGLFFSLKLKRLLYTNWQKNMDSYLQILSLKMN